MKKVILFTLLTCSTSVIFAQRTREYVVIRNQVDGPEKLKILALDIPLWHLTGSMVNTSLYNIKPSLSYVGAGKLNAGVTYNWQVGDRLFPSTYDRSEYVYQPMTMSKFKAPSAQSFSAWTTFFFKEEYVPIKEGIRLERVGNIIYMTNVDTKAYKRTGIEVGYTQGYTWYNMNKMTVVGEDIASGEKRFFDMDSKSTVQTYKTIKLGLVLTKAVNVRVEVDDYGTRRSGYLKKHSFNLLYAVQNKFDDLLVGTPNTGTNKIEFTEYAFSGDNKRLPVGFEYQFKHYTKSWFSYELCAGYYPGLLKGINLGLSAGVSVQIDMLMKNKL